MTAVKPSAPIDSPVFTGLPEAPTQTHGDSSDALATDAFVQDAVATGASCAVLLGRAGTLTALEDAADCPVIVPFDLTLERLKVTLHDAATGAMVVQLRRKAGPVTTPPTYSDVANFGCTFVNGRIVAVEIPVTPVDVDEGDVLNFSLRTPVSGLNIIVEAIGIRR